MVNIFKFLNWGADNLNMFKFTILAILLFSSLVRADWAKQDEADVTLDADNSTMDVKADGRTEITEERIFTALNDKGRNKLALQTVAYMPDSTSVKVKSAISITEGVISKVDLKQVQDRMSKGSETGISGAHELAIPFNNIKIGSQIKYTVSYKTKKPLFSGFFFQNFSYGVPFPELGGLVTIRSVKPLHYAVIDPEKALQIDSKKEKDLYVLTIQVIKPQYKIPKEVLPVLRSSQVAQVQVTTSENWAQFAKAITPGYEKVLAAKKLPAALQKIADKAKETKDPYEQMDIVTSELDNSMTYSGDWTSSDNMYYPKSLEKISRLKTGDCKDFATATTAILRNIGMDAQVALVTREGDDHSLSQLSRPIDPQIPALVFNHAIVHVNLAGKDIWLDPTNIVSNSRLIFSDIAKSPAFVISTNTDQLKSVPEAQSGESGFVVEKKIKINADNTLDTSGSIELSGDYAKSIAQVAFYKNESLAKERMLNLYGSDGAHIQYFLDGVNFKSRISQSIKGGIKTLAEKSFVVEKEEKKFLVVPLSSRLNAFLAAGTGKRATDLGVGPMAVEKSVIHIAGYDYTGKDLGCFALTPWYRIERKLIKTQEGFDVVDNFTYPQSVVTAEDLNTEKFQFSLSHIGDCGRAQAIQIKPLSTQDTLEKRTAESNKDAIAKLLDTPGPQSVTAIRQAKILVDQWLAKTPNDRDARIALYRVTYKINFLRNDIDHSEYYSAAEDVIDKLYKEYPEDSEVLRAKTYSALNLKDMDAAKNLFKLSYYASQKAQEKDGEIYLLGARLCDKMQDYDCAVKSYQKAIAVMPDSIKKGDTYSKLAEVDFNQKKIDQGFADYKLAVKYSPSDAWLYSRLISQLNYHQRYDEAVEYGEKMMSIADFGVGRNLLARAYAGKANRIMSEYTFKAEKDKSEKLLEATQETAKDLCMKSLKNDGKEVACLHLLGNFALTEAEKENNLEKAEKAYSYYSRALDNINPHLNPRGAKKNVKKAEDLMNKLREQVSAKPVMSGTRTPASPDEAKK